MKLKNAIVYTYIHIDILILSQLPSREQLGDAWILCISSTYSTVFDQLTIVFEKHFIHRYKKAIQDWQLLPKYIMDKQTHSSYIQGSNNGTHGWAFLGGTLNLSKQIQFPFPRWHSNADIGSNTSTLYFLVNTCLMYDMSSLFITIIQNYEL